jgi:hypothetical protein
MKKLSFLFLLPLALISCTTVRSITSKSMDINQQGVIQKPVVVDLDVRETKVNGTATSPSGLGENYIKSLAVADAVKKSNADILVEPMYEVITSNGQTTVNVTGFPATYRNFRMMKEEDVPLIQAGGSRVVSTSQTPPPAPPKKNQAGGVILVTLLLVGLVAGLAAALSSTP